MTERLIRLRLLLEKLKPIDKKLQYQIDKVRLGLPSCRLLSCQALSTLASFVHLGNLIELAVEIHPSRCGLQLVKLAGSTAIAQGQHDALQLRPNPANLVPKVRPPRWLCVCRNLKLTTHVLVTQDGQDDDSDDEADLEQQRQSSMEASGVYQPPRMTAMPYRKPRWLHLYHTTPPLFTATFLYSRSLTCLPSLCYLTLLC